MASILRRMMSKNRRRYTEDGFDLDLCYVTDRIIAMGFPAEGLFRNPRSEIVRLLNSRHLDHYRVYNLCEEKTYDPQSLGGEVALFPFGDHQTPSLGMIVEFCENAEQWLLANGQNIVVVHCKAGKGRTGIMICALLMYMGLCEGPEEALRLFANKRTTDGVGVTIPSQRRYIFYFAYLLRSGKRVPTPVVLQLMRIRLTGLPKHVLPRLMVCIWVRDNNTHENTFLAGVRSVSATKHHATFVRCISPSGRSFMGHLPHGERYHLLINSQELYIIFENDAGSGNKWRIRGDLKIQVFEETLSKRSSLFFTWLNTTYIEHPHIIIRRHEMDKANRCLPSQAQMEIFFSGIQPQRTGVRGSSFSGHGRLRPSSLLVGTARSQSTIHQRVSPTVYPTPERETTPGSKAFLPGLAFPKVLKDAEASWDHLSSTWDRAWMMTQIPEKH